MSRNWLTLDFSWWRHNLLLCAYGATSASTWPVSMPEASCESETLLHVGCSWSVDVFQACRKHASNKELFWLCHWIYSVVTVRLVRKKWLCHSLSMTVNCDTRTLQLNFTLRDFKPLPPNFQVRALIVRSCFQSTTDTCHTEENPRFVTQKLPS